MNRHPPTNVSGRVELTRAHRDKNMLISHQCGAASMLHITLKDRKYTFLFSATGRESSCKRADCYHGIAIYTHTHQSQGRNTAHTLRTSLRKCKNSKSSRVMQAARSPRPIRRSNKWRLTKWSQRQGVPPRTRGLSPVDARWCAIKTSHTLCIRVITTRPGRRSSKWRLSQRSPSKTRF